MLKKIFFFACLMLNTQAVKRILEFKYLLDNFFLCSRCKQGDLIEFRLKPVYHPKDDFLCHMTPLPNQKLLELEYTIKHYYNTLMTQSFTIYGDETWQKTGKLKSE